MRTKTKADLAAEVARLDEENKGMRELLAAISAVAGTVPIAKDDDAAEWSRSIRVLANINGLARVDDYDGYLAYAAGELRRIAAEPVGYEVYVGSEVFTAPADAANPPRHATVAGELVCRAEGWRDGDSNYCCTAQDGHDGPDHIAYNPGGGEYHRWPMAAPVITDSERTCDQAHPVTGAWCHRGGDHGVHRDTDGEEWRTDLPGGVVRNCLAINRETGRWCHVRGEHAEHRDLDGRTWTETAEYAGRISPTRLAKCGRHAAHDATDDCQWCDETAGPGGVLLPAACDPDNADGVTA